MVWQPSFRCALCGYSFGRADSKTVAHNFAWMRPNDLVYSYVVNDWLLGNDAPAFDVLAWNDDATNMSGTLALESNALLARGLAQSEALRVRWAGTKAIDINSAGPYG